MLDLHCHLLAGVDDGAQDLDTALAMARCLVAAGFTQAAPSPHFGEGPGGDVSIPAAGQARQVLQEALRRERIPLELLPNAEHHVTAALFERWQKREVVPIGGSGRWYLVELPWQAVPNPEDVLFRLQAKGMRLLLAHPERYSYLSIDAVCALAQRGIMLQLELGSFVGLYGRAVHAKAMEIADRGAAQVLATDLHRPKDAEVWIPEALKAVAARYGKRALHIALRENPRRLLDDVPGEDVPSFSAPT